jgi:hypothetical protein
MVYIVQRLTCPIDYEIAQDVDLWRALVQEVEMLEKTIWKVWTTTEVHCSDIIRLRAYSQNEGWHSIELMTQSAPGYLYITHSARHQQTIFTTISNSSKAIEALVSLILNLYEEATITSLMNFSQNNPDLPIRSINLLHKEIGDNLYIALNNSVPLEEMLRRYPESQWDYLGLTIHSNINDSVEFSRLYICPQSGQARFVLSDEDSFAAQTELERVNKLHKLADIIFDEHVSAPAVLVVS